MWTGRGQHGDQNLGIWIQVSDFFELPSTRSFVTRLLRVMEENKVQCRSKAQEDGVPRLFGRLVIKPLIGINVTQLQLQPWQFEFQRRLLQMSAGSTTLEGRVRPFPYPVFEMPLCFPPIRLHSHEARSTQEGREPVLFQAQSVRSRQSLAESSVETWLQEFGASVLAAPKANQSPPEHPRLINVSFRDLNLRGTNNTS